MTKEEMTGKRSLAFSGWIRKNLPDSSTGFCAGNQDWLFWNWKTRKLLLAEEKTHDAMISKWFYLWIKNVLDPALKEWCPKNNVEYYGYYLIVFEHDDPSNGKIHLGKICDGSMEEVTEEQLIKFLSMN
jgi:hypothetical protein